MVAEVNGKAIAVFNVDGTFMPSTTPVHRGGPLGEGDVVGDVVACPWHNWEFNVKTGACINNPSAKVTAYEVTVEGTDIKVGCDAGTRRARRRHSTMIMSTPREWRIQWRTIS